MAKHIQFTTTGGPDVLQYLEFTPSDPAPHEVQVEIKLSVSIISILMSAAGFILLPICPVV